MNRKVCSFHTASTEGVTPLPFVLLVPNSHPQPEMSHGRREPYNQSLGLVAMGVAISTWLSRSDPSQNKGPLPFGIEPSASDSRHASTALSQRFRYAFTVVAWRVFQSTFTLRQPSKRVYEGRP